MNKLLSKNVVNFKLVMVALYTIKFSSNEINTFSSFGGSTLSHRQQANFRFDVQITTIVYIANSQVLYF